MDYTKIACVNIKIREAKAPKGVKCLEVNKTEASTASSFVSLHSTIKVTKGDSLQRSPFAFPSFIEGSPPGAAENLVSPPPSLVSPEEIRFEFEERAAIFEYEGGFTRKEAEERAYRQTLKGFISGRYPEVLAEFEVSI